MVGDAWRAATRAALRAARTGPRATSPGYPLKVEKTPLARPGNSEEWPVCCTASSVAGIDEYTL